MIGNSRLPLSNTKNLPMFTLSPKTDVNRKVVISSKHVQDQLGRDSPGVGTYQFDFNKMSKSVLNSVGPGGIKGSAVLSSRAEFSFGSTEKYFELTSVTKLKKEK